MAEEKKTDLEYLIPDHAAYDLGAEILKTSRRKKTARRIIRYTSFIMIVFIIISYLGYTLGQYFASATTLSVRTNAPRIALAQVGFRLETPIDSRESERYNLTLDSGVVASGPGIGYVYWTGENVSSETLAFILEHDKHASQGKLQPVTARWFDSAALINDPITLFDRPRALQTIREVVEDEAALKQDYMALTILFRLLVSSDTTQQVALDNFGVYFTRDTKFTGSTNLLNAMRVSVESPIVRDIISPGRKLTLESGYRDKINVGGRLDLDGANTAVGRHGYYDYTAPIAVPGEEGLQRYEIAYGDFEFPLTNESWGEVTTFADPVPENNTSQIAATYVGVRPLLGAIPKTQDYTNFEKYTRISEQGDPIAYTNEFGIAEFDMQIWIEGWDPNSSEKIVGSTFGAELKFEVAKKDLEE